MRERVKRTVMRRVTEQRGGRNGQWRGPFFIPIPFCFNLSVLEASSQIGRAELKLPQTRTQLSTF